MSSRSQILRSTSIVGGAAAINIVVGLIRTKCAALLIGPAGIGVIGLFLNLVQFVATIGVLGLGTSAVRQIAEALSQERPEEVAAARRALFWLITASAVLVGTTFAFSTDLIWRLMSFNPNEEFAGPWLAIAVAATILSSAPIALLIGYRRIVDQAIVQVGGAILGSIIGLGCLYALGEGGIVGYTIAAPVTQLAFGMLLTLRIPRLREVFSFSLMRDQAKAMVGLGLPFTIGALSMTGGLLALRSLIADRLGVLALGQFTAGWTLCVTYVGFVLQATGTDYFPRLSGKINNRSEAHGIINDQIEISILISLPIIISIQAVSPWLLTLLYSQDFSGAIAVIRWQILGDVFKIASTPAAYVMLATRRGGTYWTGETLAITILVLGSSLLMERLGLAAVGVAYAIMCVTYSIFSFFIAWWIIGFKPNPKIIKLLISGILLVTIVTIISMTSPCLGLIVGLPLSLGAALFAIQTLKIHNFFLRKIPWLRKIIPHSYR